MPVMDMDGGGRSHDRSTSRPKRPWYQRVLVYWNWLLAGVLGLGALLGAVRNAIFLIPPIVTYIGSAVLILSWLALQVYASARGIPWVRRDGAHRVKWLGLQPALAFLGVAFVLWSPRVYERLVDRKAVILHVNPTVLFVGDEARFTVFINEKAIDASFICKWDAGDNTWYTGPLCDAPPFRATSSVPPNEPKDISISVEVFDSERTRIGSAAAVLTVKNGPTVSIRLSPQRVYLKEPSIATVLVGGTSVGPEYNCTWTADKELSFSETGRCEASFKLSLDSIDPDKQRSFMIGVELLGLAHQGVAPSKNALLTVVAPPHRYHEYVLDTSARMNSPVGRETWLSLSKSDIADTLDDLRLAGGYFGLELFGQPPTTGDLPCTNANELVQLAPVEVRSMKQKVSALSPGVTQHP